MREQLTKFLRFLGIIIYRTPFYPHWLGFRQTSRGDDYVIGKARGMVLEIGCGDKEVRREKFEAVAGEGNYIGLDYPG